MLVIECSHGGLIIDSKETIYTVFPISNDPNDKWPLPPQDFETYAEAEEYAESLDCEYVIESAG